MMRILLALLLAGCAPATSSLIAHDAAAGNRSWAPWQSGDTAITVTVHNTMPGSLSKRAFIYPVFAQSTCLYPPGFDIDGGENKSMSGTPAPSCYPIVLQINSAFFDYVCTLTITAPGSYAVKHGGAAACTLAQQSQDAVTVGYGQVLGPDDTPGGPVSRRRL